MLQNNFVAINLKYFNENFDVIIYFLLQQTIYYFEYLVTIGYYFMNFITVDCKELIKIIWVQIIAMVYLL